VYILIDKGLQCIYLFLSRDNSTV